MKVNLIGFLNNSVRPLFFVAIFLVCGANGLFAQDSTEVNSEEKPKKEEKKVLDPEEIIARQAAFRSAIIPGWGQATNGGAHFIKIPIIYAGLAVSSYSAYFNHTKFQCYEKGYFLKSNNLYFEGCDGFNTISTLKSGMEAYHKQRDLFVIVTFGVYALNILDAYIWAHMNQFDNSNDLSLRLKPSFINIAGQPHSAFTLTMRF